jgi:hypothetical protein
MRAFFVATAVAALAAALGTALGASRASAQGGLSSAVLLELPTSARALALGGAYSAVGGDDAAVFFNPAQLATRTTMSAGLSVQRYALQSTLAAFSAAAHIGPGMAGLGIQLLDYGSVPELVPDDNFGGQKGTPTGAEVTANDLALSGSYAMRRGRVRAGVTAKLVRQSIADESGSTVAGDLGVAVDAGRGVTVAASIQHVGGSLTLGGTSSALPRTLRAGAAIPLHPTKAVDLLFVGEYVKGRTTAGIPSGGAEVAYRASSTLTLIARAGGSALPATSDASPFTFGGGISSAHIAVDYAYNKFDDFAGPTHRIGVRWWR